MKARCELIFPANNFLTSDGSEYNGVVNIDLTTWDPAVQEDAVDVPGDFSVTQENPEDPPAAMASLGVFCIGFLDEEGNELTPREGCVFRMFVDSPLLALLPDVDLRLWTLDPTRATWDENSVLTGNDSVVTTTQPITGTIGGNIGEGMFVQGLLSLIRRILDINIDFRLQVCYLKIRIFAGPNLGEGIDLSEITVNIIIYVIDAFGNRFWIYRNSAVTNEEGCVCLPVIYPPSYLNNRLRFIGEITATDKEGNMMIPAEPQQSGLPDDILQELEYQVIQSAIESLIRYSDDSPLYQTLQDCRENFSLHFRFFKSSTNPDPIDDFMINPNDENEPPQ